MVQERNASAYRTPRRSTPVPAQPRFSTGARQASQADVLARQADAGGRTAHYQMTGRDGTARTNDVSWGGQGADPLAGLFQATPPISRGGSSYGSGGGGSSYGSGGGGAAALDPKVIQAYKDLYTHSSTTNDQQMWDTYEGLMRKAYDPSRINASFDQAAAAARQAAATGRAGVRSAATDGMGRLVPIMQGLDSRAATARTGVNQAMSDTDARLAALQAEYQAQAGETNQGLNNVMQAFGAGPVQDTGAQSLQNLFANSRVANTRAQGIMDASLADRPAVYAGLNADVQSGISRDQSGLENRLAQQEAAALAQLAQQRAAGLQQNDTALQQLLAQTGISRVQSEQQRKRDELELRARLAEMGIVV